MSEAELFEAHRNLTEERSIEETGNKGEEVEEERVRTRLERMALELDHQGHSSRGENHWFTCAWCDDEDPDG